MCRTKCWWQIELVGSAIYLDRDHLSLLTIDPSMKSWSEDLEGKVSDASGDILFISRGRGYCWAREGLDNLPIILAFLPRGRKVPHSSLTLELPTG